MGDKKRKLDAEANEKHGAGVVVGDASQKESLDGKGKWVRVGEVHMSPRGGNVAGQAAHA